MRTTKGKFTYWLTWIFSMVLLMHSNSAQAVTSDKEGVTDSIRQQIVVGNGVNATFRFSNDSAKELKWNSRKHRLTGEKTNDGNDALTTTIYINMPADGYISMAAHDADIMIDDTTFNGAYDYYRDSDSQGERHFLKAGDHTVKVSSSYGYLQSVLVEGNYDVHDYGADHTKEQTALRLPYVVDNKANATYSWSADFSQSSNNSWGPVDEGLNTSAAAKGGLHLHVDYPTDGSIAVLYNMENTMPGTAAAPSVHTVHIYVDDIQQEIGDSTHLRARIPAGKHTVFIKLAGDYSGGGGYDPTVFSITHISLEQSADSLLSKFDKISDVSHQFDESQYYHTSCTEGSKVVLSDSYSVSNDLSYSFNADGPVELPVVASHYNHTGSASSGSTTINIDGTPVLAIGNEIDSLCYISIPAGPHTMSFQMDNTIKGYVTFNFDARYLCIDNAAGAKVLFIENHPYEFEYVNGLLTEAFTDNVNYNTQSPGDLKIIAGHNMSLTYYYTTTGRMRLDSLKAGVNYVSLQGNTFQNDTISHIVIGAVDLSCLNQGKGMADDPYLISTASQLKAFAYNLYLGHSDIHGKLTRDITLNDRLKIENDSLVCDTEALEEWISVAEDDGTYNFTGTLDGDGHTISGLYSLHGGLIDINHGVIKNLSLTNAYINPDRYYAGGIANSNYGTIYNCSMDGAIVAKQKVSGSPWTASDIAGIAGINNKGTISHCTNYADVISRLNNYIGGITTENSGSVTYCSNSGKIVAMSQAGGIVSDMQDGGSISHCYNAGDVVYSDDYKDDVMGYDMGGICGNPGYNSTTITYCYNAGDIYATSQSGGIGGYSSNGAGRVSHCFNVGNIYYQPSTGKMSYGRQYPQGALLGSIYANGINSSLSLVSDCYTLADRVKVAPGVTGKTVGDCNQTGIQKGFIKILTDEEFRKLSLDGMVSGYYHPVIDSLAISARTAHGNSVLLDLSRPADNTIFSADSSADARHAYNIAHPDSDGNSVIERLFVTKGSPLTDVSGVELRQASMLLTLHSFQAGERQPAIINLPYSCKLPANVEAYEWEKTNPSKVDFVSVDSIRAGKAYLVRLDSTVSTAGSVLVNFCTSQRQPLTATVVNNDLMGALTAPVYSDDLSDAYDYYVLADSSATFVKMPASNIPGTRLCDPISGYLRVPSSMQASDRLTVTYNDDRSSTGIQKNETEHPHEAKVYSISGVYMGTIRNFDGKDSINQLHLPAGIYIAGGRKYVVR